MFSFHAAYAAINPPASDETVDDQLSERERETWSKEAMDAWNDLKTIDPDQSVLSCSESEAGELMVSFAQAELIGHLRNRLSPRTAREYHERLARYLVNPIEKLDREDYGDRYYRANLAAEHWSLAIRPRDAADAHRHAAQLAELSLAYGESQKHYENAIRLYTQLLAERRDPTRDHEDLLILANCYYRVGQTTRLSGRPEKVDEEPKHGKRPQEWGAINYLERAGQRLEELKKLLLENEPDRWPDGITGPCTRGIPGPNLVRHYLRVYNAVSGHVHLELAQCHESVVDQCRARAGDELHTCNKCEPHRNAIRDRLFDALRHAEAAQGEAGSRWLLAAASARLAALLTDQSLRLQREEAARSAELAVEAFFHIERIIGLEPYTAEEKHEFADPVSVAWRTAGRLFRHHALQARIAEWCFRKMNAHDADVAATIDMVTDRWLGGFLLSICQPGGSTETVEEARKLLMRHRNWAIESGLVDRVAPAHLRLYLLEFVANATSREDLSKAKNQKARRKHLASARRVLGLTASDQQAGSDQQKRDIALYEALEEILSPGTRWDRVIEWFKHALPIHQSGGSDDEVIQRGSKKLAGLLLRRCPRLHELIEVRLQEVIEPHSEGMSDLNYWLDRARKYESSLQGECILSPCIDTIPHIEDEDGAINHYTVIKHLAKSRLPETVFRQAEKTANWAMKLLEIHGRTCEREEEEHLDILRRDVQYAAYMHDWYRGTDPVRLLTLASEWNLTISGEEWSNPRLLQGRLAATVLKKMYDAERVLGQSRYQRITNMVENCVVGRTQQSALGKVFFLANAISEQLYKAPYEQENESRIWLIGELVAMLGDTVEDEMLGRDRDVELSVTQQHETELDREEEDTKRLDPLTWLYEAVVDRKKEGLWDWELGYTKAAAKDSKADALPTNPR